VVVADPPVRRYQLLGDVRAFDGDEALALGASKPRSLLAILLLRAGSVVPTEVVCDLLWSGEPPRSAATTLHGYISGLRRTLGPESIRTESPGYVVHLGDQQLDTATFAELVTLGREAAEDGRYERAAQAFRTALDLWRGPALTGVTDQPWAVADAARLEEARLAATDDWAGVELQLGRHAEIVEALQAAVRAAPLRENLRGRLALSLYRSGRQAEALQCLADGRRLLADELGIDPGAALVELQAAILAQDPALDHRRRPDPGVTAPVDPTVTLAATGSVFVGRDRELGELRVGLDRAIAGSANVVVLAGEPGIGKTELARVIADEAERRGGVVAWGRCHEGAGAPAYWPWAELTDTLVRRLGGADVESAAGAGLGDLTALGTQLLPQQPGQLELDPEAARFRIARAVTGLLRNLGERQVVLLAIDDLQWADPPSLELLGSVVRSLDDARVMIVCTLRTSAALLPPVTRALAELARAQYRRLELGGLDEEAVGELVSGGLVALPSDEVAELRRRTAGNPLFVTQLASWMGAVSDTGARAALPAAVGDVVTERVGRLPELAATILSDASILGTDLDVDGLTAVTGLEAAAVLDGLAPALAAGLLVRDDLPGRWRFVHGVVSETLRSSLGPDRSARLHLRAAQGLRDNNGGRPGPHLSALAAHLVDAAPLVDRAEVVAALATAAGWNAEHLAFEQAFGQVERALEVIDRMPEGEARDGAELEVQGLRAQLILTTSGYGRPELGEACRRMRVLCGRLETGSQLAPAVLWRLIVMHTARCELDTAVDLGQEVATLNDASAASIQLSHMGLGTTLTHRGDIAAARAHFDAALAGLAGSRGGMDGVVAETPEVWIAVFSAWNRWLSGDADAAEREVLAAVELAGQQGELTYAHTFAHWFSGLIAVLREDPETALRRCDQGIDLAQRGGFLMLLPFMRTYRGWAVGRTGDVDVAIAEIEAGAELATATGTRMLQHVFPAFLADTHLSAGRPDEAAIHARAGLEAADLTGERWYEPELHRLLGLALAETDPTAALTSLRRAVDLADTQGNLSLRDRARESLAQLA
jgi:DNA-binding SARP family transcriptional activator